MKCLQCDVENEESAKFCSSCGVELVNKKFKESNFKNIKMLTYTLIYVLYAYILYDLLSIGSYIYEYYLWKKFENTSILASSVETTIKLLESYMHIIDNISLILSLILLVLIPLWFFKVNKNSRALGAINMRYSPLWSALWFFIPIFNIWKPIQVLKELYYTSLKPKSWKIMRQEIQELHTEKNIFDWKSLKDMVKKNIVMEAVITFWWGINIFRVFFIVAYTYEVTKAGISNHFTEIKVESLSSSFDIISILFLIITITTIYKKQAENNFQLKE